MANSTFSGPVRSEGGFQHLATNSTSGNQINDKVEITTAGKLVVHGTNANNTNRSALTSDRYFLTLTKHIRLKLQEQQTETLRF